jgi:4-amino-4-deoxy-L-arabinose transferase-like glycosyltransferase
MKAFYYPLTAGLLASALLLFVAIPAATEIASSHYALGFADDYDRLAVSLANGEGYRLGPALGETMLREPGYPLFLAGVFSLLGYSIEAARVANLLLAGIAAALLWLLARRITRDRLVAGLAVLLFMLHPAMLIAEARGGVEVLFITAVLGFLLLLYRAVDTDRTALFLISGLALGIAVLIRSTPLLFPIVLGPCLLLVAPAGARIRRLGQCMVLVLGMTAVMLPWIVRNYGLSGHFVPTATVQGVAAQEGQYTCERMPPGQRFQALQREAASQRNARAARLGVPFKAGYYQYFYSAADELAFNRALTSDTLQHYRSQPGLLARCAGMNLLNFWFLGKNAVATGLNAVLQLPLLALAVAGIVLLHRRYGIAAWALPALLIVYVVSVHAPVIAHARHSVPLLPLLSIFAAAALVHAWQRLALLRRLPAGSTPRRMAGISP